MTSTSRRILLSFLLIFHNKSCAQCFCEHVACGVRPSVPAGSAFMAVVWLLWDFLKECEWIPGLLQCFWQQTELRRVCHQTLSENTPNKTWTEATWPSALCSVQKSYSCYLVQTVTAQLPRSPKRGLNMDSTDVLAVTQAPKNKFPSAVDFLGAPEIHPGRFQFNSILFI